MRAREAARAYLPARVQDVLRSANDIASSRRRRARKDIGVDELAHAVSPTGLVLGGPFAGLLLGARTSWGGAAARLAGTYEEELTTAVEAFISCAPRLVVDVGAAEGYFAVGLARRLSSAQVVSFDIDPLARSLTRQNARLNGVQNISVRGRATPRVLDRVLGSGEESLVLCDCEGYESVLIEPRAVPGLRRAMLLVELHEVIVPGVTHLITERFAPSHQVELVTATPRIAAGRSELAHLPERAAQRAVEEGRPAGAPMQWAVMMPQPD